MTDKQANGTMLGQYESHKGRISESRELNIVKS